MTEKVDKLCGTYRKAQVLAFVVVGGDVSSCNGQQTSQEKEDAVDCEQCPEKSSSVTRALISDWLGDGWHVDGDTLQVREENHPKDGDDDFESDTSSDDTNEGQVRDLRDA